MKKKLIHGLDVLSRYVGVISRWSGEIFLFAMVLLITVDVIGRATGNATMVADELSRYMLVAIVFLGLAHTQQAARHIEVNLITRLFSKKRQEQLALVAFIISTAFVWWLFIATIQNPVYSFVRHTTSLSYIDVPMWIPHMLVPLGVGLFAIVMLIELINMLSKPK